MIEAPASFVPQRVLSRVGFLEDPQKSKKIAIYRKRNRQQGPYFRTLFGDIFDATESSSGLDRGVWYGAKYAYVEALNIPKQRPVLEHQAQPLPSGSYLVNKQRSWVENMYYKQTFHANISKN